MTGQEYATLLNAGAPGESFVTRRFVGTPLPSPHVRTLEGSLLASTKIVGLRPSPSRAICTIGAYRLRVMGHLNGRGPVDHSHGEVRAPRQKYFQRCCCSRDARAADSLVFVTPRTYAAIWFQSIADSRFSFGIRTVISFCSASAGSETLLKSNQ
jgi:hypothetical protein